MVNDEQVDEQHQVNLQTECESLTTVGSPAWHKKQIALYSNEHGVFTAYASALERLLKTASATRAPLAIIHSRAKSVSSFAEKALKLKDGHYRYRNPINELTDLCGARVITQTQEEADRIGRFIEATFTIDRANSCNVRARLLHDQFGYRSVHYVISLPETTISGLDEAAQKMIGTARKAEIQVRTLLQHVWADIGHDRLYKSQMAYVPEAWIRESARLAAVLEKVDDGFASLVRQTEAYSLHYGALKTRERVQSEMEATQTILDNEQEFVNKQAVAVRKARLLRAAGSWEDIIALLGPNIVPDDSLSNPLQTRGEGAVAPQQNDIAARHQASVLLELGHALCQANHPGSNNARRGQEYLARVARPDDDPARMTDDPDADKLRTFALNLLAQSMQDQIGQGREALALFHAAIRREPSNPYYLVDAIAQEISVLCSHEFLRLMRPALEAAIETCRAHAAAEIALPWAYLTMGKAQLFLGEPHEALGSYAKAVSYYLDPKLWLPTDMLNAEIAFVRRAQSGSGAAQSTQLAGGDWIVELLELATKAKLARDGNPISTPQNATDAIAGQVVIVIGGTDQSIEARMQDYKDIFEAAFEKFSGTVISGGTTAGISGLMGRVAAGLSSRRTYRLLGYRPTEMPGHAQPDERYDEQRMTPGATDFTVREPFAYWRDILSAGISPVDVILVGINGGRISAFEYRLALALGATVGIVGGSGRSAEAMFSDSDWLDSPNLIWLADNPISVVALMVPRTLPTHLDTAAREAHDEYRRLQLPPPVMRDWALLQDDLKDSNRSQILCASDVLRLAGYGIRAQSARGGVDEFPQSAIDAMAAMEHARWIVERRKRKWKYGGRRDQSKQESPNLIPWQNLPNEIKANNRRTVISWPKVLKKAGLEIFKM